MIYVMHAEATPAQTPEVEGAQSITIPAFQTLMGELNIIGGAAGRRL